MNTFGNRSIVTEDETKQKTSKNFNAISLKQQNMINTYMPNTAQFLGASNTGSHKK